MKWVTRELQICLYQHMTLYLIDIRLTESIYPLAHLLVQNLNDKKKYTQINITE